VRVVSLVESVDHVCCRYRLAAFRAAFTAAGHTFDIQSLPTGTFGRLTLGRGLRDADTVILQRKLLPRWTIALLRRRVRRLVFDFDDAVWLRDSYSPKGFDDSKRLERFRATLAACDLVVAGNDFLATEARRHTAPDRVIVVPTCVEPAKYPASRHESQSSSLECSPLAPRAVGGVSHVQATIIPKYPLAPRADHTQTQIPQRVPSLQLVWVGSHSTLRGLERFTHALSAVGEAVHGVRLKLICDRFLKIPGLTVDECVWSEDTEGAEIAAADVGIAWVPDDPWSQGKCGLKILQYQAAGLAVIANPVGVQPEMVRNRETGFLATTTDEWVAAVRELATDVALRRQLGLAGRRQVEDRYSVAVGARAWLAALERLCSDSQARRDQDSCSPTC